MMRNADMIKKEFNAMKVCLAVLLIVALGMVACTVTPVTTTSPDELRIITEISPPYNFVDKDYQITGQSTEIVQAIMEATGTHAEIETMPWSEGLALAETGPGIVLYSTNRTPQRIDLFKWVGPIGSYEQAFFAKKGSGIEIKSLEDAMKINKIGVYKDDAGEQFLESQGFENLDISMTDSEALQKLMKGDVDLWLGTKDGLALMAEEASVNVDDLELMPTVVINADLYIAFSKDVSDSIVTEWQTALDKLKTERDIDDKTAYEKILAKWDDPEYVQMLLNED
jgi:polar amino acid transport system substrate-binding protein